MTVEHNLDSFTNSEEEDVYIDRTCETLDRLAGFVERIRRDTCYLGIASAQVGIALPADAINWRNVWNRDNAGAPRAATEARIK